MESPSQGSDTDTTGDTCRHLPHLTSLVEPLVALLSARAAKEGANAFRAGNSRDIPPQYGTYSGCWLKGYEDAAYAGLACICCAAILGKQASQSNIS